MTSHTKGPWIVGPFDMIWPASDVAIVDGRWMELVPEPRIIASASKGNLLPDEDRANARLIAAAPVLLEALKKISDLIDSEADDPLDDAIAIANKAISKAEGRTS